MPGAPICMNLELQLNALAKRVYMYIVVNLISRFLSSTLIARDARNELAYKVAKISVERHDEDFEFLSHLLKYE